MQVKNNTRYMDTRDISVKVMIIGDIPVQNVNLHGINFKSVPLLEITGCTYVSRDII